jgi:hypothetical protein
LGFDHLAYRLGMRERTALAVIQFVALGLIGGWLAWEVIAGRVSRAQGIALLSPYSVISRLHLRGWLGSTPEGRRPQIRGFRTGGSLAVASSTPATQLLLPAKMLKLNHAQFPSASSP